MYPSFLPAVAAEIRWKRATNRPCWMYRPIRRQTGDGNHGDALDGISEKNQSTVTTGLPQPCCKLTSFTGLAPEVCHCAPASYNDYKSHIRHAIDMIHVRHLRKSYPDLQNGQQLAVDDISFDAMPGEIFGLLGPNGAGKTTVLRILSTVLHPTGGTASVNGFDVVQQAEQVRRQIGFVSTNTAIYDRMTGWEMVEFFGLLYGISIDVLHQRMERLFERFQMNSLRDLLGSCMSTGMKQKVSIARAMIHDPPVLIFDEATSGLDILAAREVLATVEQLRDQGKCILFSSHIMSEVQRICDRLAIMHHGQILAHGTLEQLKHAFGDVELEDLFFDLISDRITTTTYAANEELSR